MGLIADNAGVLGGIGQALQTNSANKREERLMQMKMDREDAVAALERDFKKGENQKDRDVTTSEGSKNRQVDVGRIMSAEDQAKADRASKESEGALDRKSAEKVAGIRATATAAGGRAKKRFTTNKVAKESMKAGGEMSKTEDVVLTDNESGQTFQQVGDKFLPQGGQVRKEANQEALNHLRTNPDSADQFLQHYGYLPVGVFATGTAASDSTNDEE